MEIPNAAELVRISDALIDALHEAQEMTRGDLAYRGVADLRQASALY